MLGDYMGSVREPIKKTSIEKKRRIIEKGFELMCDQGYHNVTCVDIAKYADVSTGIIYQYFKDKHDIFIAGVKSYASSIMYTMIKILDQNNIDNIKYVVEQILEQFIKTHKMSKKAHEELMAMSHIDSEVSQIFKNNEMEISNKIVNCLNSNGFKINKINEKVHIIVGLIDNFCHETIYHQHAQLDYDYMKNEIVSIILNLLKGV
jgi:AcrR family transcriptional regulator